MEGADGGELDLRSGDRIQQVDPTGVGGGDDPPVAGADAEAAVDGGLRDGDRVLPAAARSGEGEEVGDGLVGGGGGEHEPGGLAGRGGAEASGLAGDGAPEGADGGEAEEVGDGEVGGDLKEDLGGEIAPVRH